MKIGGNATLKDCYIVTYKAETPPLYYNCYNITVKTPLLI